MKAEPWLALSRRQLFQTPIFTIYQQRARSPLSGREHEFAIVDCPHWVNVIALTPENKLVLIRQFRHGTGQITLEIPGGMADRDEAPLRAAQRELAEETGYTSTDWQEIGMVEPNPAFQTNRTYTFVARGAQRTQEPQPDDNEEIEVLERQLSDIPQLIAGRQITHALVVAAFYHFSCWQGCAGEPTPG